MTVKGTAEVVGIEINRGDEKVLRIGFDLFQEISFLLSSGQPEDYASIPTLDIHILMLRNWILSCGIHVLEIPPVPAGYAFMTCLTHDVDFLRIRNHRFDHTVFGFVYRALFGSLIDFLRGRASWRKLLKNWKAVVCLPCVYLGIVEDFWVQFDRYVEVEKGLGSTFFMIPFKDQPGKGVSGQAPKRRAARYDISDVESHVKRLVSKGCEIGVHGIDAWRDSEKGNEEFKRISRAVGRSDIGIRMHWLFYNDQSPENLERAGFLYDSTLGYNDAIGYRVGTTQVFRPPGAKRLLELPMHIQDTALFYPKRLGLNESIASELIGNIFENATHYGGVLTINWHHRSMGPERLWGDFYVNLLGELKKHEVWFATASRVIKWFDKRRSVTFEKTRFSENKLLLTCKGENDDSLPPLSLRIHCPGMQNTADKTCGEHTQPHIDIPWTGEERTELPLESLGGAGNQYS